MTTEETQRATEFAYQLLDSNVPPFEVYRETIDLLSAIDRKDQPFSVITPEMMETAAKAVQAAQNRLDEARLHMFQPCQHELEVKA